MEKGFEGKTHTTDRPRLFFLLLYVTGKRGEKVLSCSLTRHTHTHNGDDGAPSDRRHLTLFPSFSLFLYASQPSNLIRDRPDPHTHTHIQSNSSLLIKARNGGRTEEGIGFGRGFSSGRKKGDFLSRFFRDLSFIAIFLLLRHLERRKIDVGRGVIVSEGRSLFFSCVNRRVNER